MAATRGLIGRRIVMGALVIASSTAAFTGLSLFVYSAILTVWLAAAGGALIGVSVICTVGAWTLWVRP